MKKLTWIKVTDWLKAPFLKSLYMIPGVAAILISIVNWGNEHLSIGTFTIPTNLLILAFSSIFLLVALVIHALKCPQKIKEFGNRRKFLTEKMVTEEIIGLDVKINIVVAQAKAFSPKTIAALTADKKAVFDETDAEKKEVLASKLAVKADRLHKAAVLHKLENEWKNIAPDATAASQLCGILLILCFTGIGTVLLINIFKIIVYAIKL